MLRFTLGAITSALVYYLVANHPEVVRQAVAAVREQLDVAARNISAATSRTDRPDGAAAEAEEPIRVQPHRAQALAEQMADMSHEQLWAMMHESDFDRRAAASEVLLNRANIPPSTQGIQLIKERYFRSGHAQDLKTGFSYIGLLTYHDVPQEAIVMQAQRFVERYPRHEACDYAVWALGELGSEEMIAYLFQIIEDPQKYGPIARERAFCCLAQCGRYSPARRLRMVPDFIEVYNNTDDAETQNWSMQALSYCAPRAHARSIDDWNRWWSRQ